MRQPFLFKLFACLLAVLLLFGGTAKELVHQFAGHEDTVHTHCASKGELSIEPQHHHCEFLHFILPAFEAPPEMLFTFKQETALPTVRPTAAPPHLWLVRSFSFVVGRGPPRLPVCC